MTTTVVVMNAAQAAEYKLTHPNISYIWFTSDSKGNIVENRSLP